MNFAPSIVLLTANLAPGGVTDHVRALAAALREIGASAALATRDEPPRAAAPGEWLALHFVAYAWARHGILGLRELTDLRAAASGRRVAIYFHELWIGESGHEPFKNRVVGLFQRRGIRRLLAALRPAHVLTSNPVYAGMLGELGHPAEVLPLPGNLPRADEDARTEARRWLAARGAGASEARAALFGTIHPEWRGEDAVTAWCADAARRGLSPRLLALGRLGAAAPARLAALRAAAPSLRIEESGKLPAPLLAGLLAECELAFATSPWALIGKSGSAAAFREAGLPMLVTRDDWRRRRGPTPLPAEAPGLRLWPADGRGLDWPSFLADRPPAESVLGRVVDSWIRLLGAGPTA